MIENITAIVAPPGSGKSRLICEIALAQRGINVVAFPTIELLLEQHAYYAAAAGRTPIFSVHSGARPTAVARQWQDALDHVAERDVDHAVILVTHQLLMSGHLADVPLGHVFVDEVPAAVQSGRVTATRSFEYLESLFELQPSEVPEWSTLKAREHHAPWRASEQDVLHRELVDLELLARRPGGIFVDVDCWTEARRAKGFHWISAWTPHDLNCESLTFAGAGVCDSLMFQVMRFLNGGEVNIEHFSLPARSSPLLPRLRLHFFVESHRASTAFWRTLEGRRVLSGIRSHLATVDLGYWSANDVAKEQLDTVLPAETYVRPKIAGLNRLSDRSSCAFIFSSQATPADAPLRRFGICSSMIAAARETEDAIQFLWRGLLRDPAFTGTFDAYVYDRRQAEAIAARVSTEGLATVELVPELDAGVMHVTRSLPQRSSEDGAAKQQARREADAKRKRLARARKAELIGREPGRAGRPPCRGNSHDYESSSEWRARADQASGWPCDLEIVPKTAGPSLRDLLR